MAANLTKSFPGGNEAFTLTTPTIMSSPVTIISTLPIRSGVTIEDESFHPGKLWRDYICTIGVQSGFQRVYWGRQVENENLVDLFVGE